jgi:hypothetical protein
MPPSMFLKPLGVYSQVQLTEVHLDVPFLSCIRLKMAIFPLSFQAITFPTLL